MWASAELTERQETARWRAEQQDLLNRAAVLALDSWGIDEGRDGLSVWAKIVVGENRDVTFVPDITQSSRHRMYSPKDGQQVHKDYPALAGQMLFISVPMREWELRGSQSDTISLHFMLGVSVIYTSSHFDSACPQCTEHVQQGMVWRRLPPRTEGRPQ
jgi:hypothetical protein